MKGQLNLDGRKGLENQPKSYRRKKKSGNYSKALGSSVESRLNTDI